MDEPDTKDFFVPVEAVDTKNLHQSGNLNFYVVTNPLVAPTPSTSEEVNETAGVFIINPITTEFKEEPEDPPPEDDSDAENIIDDKSEDKISDDDDNALVIDYSDKEESHADDYREADNSNSLLVISTTKKPKVKKLSMPKMPRNDDRQRVRAAFTDYFKGLRPDFERLTPQRMELFKTTLRQMMKEQNEED